MKKLLYHINSYLLPVLLATIVCIQTGCKKDNTPSSSGAPLITNVRSYVASPGDEVINKLALGSVNSEDGGYWVVISGQNLKGVTNVYFDGVAANTNDAWNSDNTAIVRVPDAIPFPIVPTNLLNTITYITTHGQTTFSFNISSGTPTITRISNEYAKPGDSVKIYGKNFFDITSITYAGLPITDYTYLSNGTEIRIKAPAGMSQSGGTVIVKTKGGTASTIYTVHDFITGVFCNWDNINTYPWGSNTSGSSTDYPGNSGTYDVMGATNVGFGTADNAGAWYENPRSINMGDSQWVPVSVLQDSASHYALKFEISVLPTTPWVNGTLYLQTYAANNLAAYNPWLAPSGKTIPFITNGWQTVTIPISSFNVSSSGKVGAPPVLMSDVVGPTGNTYLSFRFMNFAGSSPVVSFAAGIDNVRVVKIK